MHRPIYCSPPNSSDSYSSRILIKLERVTLRCGAALAASLLFLAGAMASATARADVYRSAQKAQDEQGVTLEPRKPIKREIGGGAMHSYRLTLAAGQYAWVAVDQFRINVAVSVAGPDGKKLFEVDVFGIGDPERVLLAAETPGDYRLDVLAPDQTAPVGHYEIKIRELRAATEQDKSLVAAERLLLEGILLERQLTADSWRKAIEIYKQSIPFSKSAIEPAWEATALYLISNVYVSLGEKQQAFDFANQALMVAQSAPKKSDEELRRLGVKVEANALDTIGRVHNEFGDKKKALELFNQALPLKRAIGDRLGEVNTLNSMAMAHQFMGDYQKALDLSIRARLILGELGYRGREVTTLNNICTLHSSLGENKKALDFCNQALSIARELKEPRSEATALNSLGNALANLGEYQKALDSYTQSHAIHKRVGNIQSQAILLNNIGFIYAALGDYRKAIEIYNQALEIFRASGDQYREANVLNNIAANYANLSDFRKALEIGLQVLPLRRVQNNREGLAITLNNVANYYANLGEKQKSLDYYNRSIELHRAVGNPRHLATALKNIGALYLDLGERLKALDYFNEALKITRTIGDRNNEAGVQAHLARVERDRGNLIEAKSRIDEALAAVESLRVNVQSHQLRAAFFASVRKYHEFNIDLLMRLHKQRPSAGFDAAALQASERARARSLLELLTEAGAQIRQGVDPALLERERTLRQSISDKADFQTRLLSGKHTQEQARAAAKEIDALTTDYEQVEARIRQTSPRYAALTLPVPLTLQEIQRDVLDDETLLLEYSLGEEKSYLWAVTPTSIGSFELPRRAEIESAAQRVYETLTARNRTIANETPAQWRGRLEQADAEYLKASSSLSRMLLGPVASELKSKRLVVVGEGMLQYTAFAALPAPVTRPADVSSPLIADHEIISLPSASALWVLRREAAGRRTGDKSVAVFADPVFDSGDPRIRQPGSDRATAGEEADPMGDLSRSVSESGLPDLVRLRFSRQEADQIIRFATEGKKFKAVDFAANRPSATSPEMRNYSIIHFATHGLINHQHPELSGIVLSLVDEQGRPQNGFLRLYDIYNLKLEANLVTLSACQTALGKDIKGEGLVGLTRGFMYAGAPRVVASLWRVEDRATAVLMGRFYEAMLRRGLRPAAALREAQISMARDRRWRAPHNWAAFTLQGEWR